MDNYIEKGELEKDLECGGIPKSYASEIIKLHGNNDGTIYETTAAKIRKELQQAFKTDDMYRPKTLLEDSTFTPEEITDYFNWRLDGIKEKYKPFGLELPLKSLEYAHAWLRKESLEGVLSTERIPCPAMEIEDRDIYLGSLITMPYRKRINDKGLIVIDNLICNYSPF